MMCALGCGTMAVAQNEPFRDVSLSPSERAADLLSRLTLEEKVGLMMDVSRPVERLGVRTYNWWNEALHGVARAGTAMVLPQSIGMAATFDDVAVEEAFTAVSDEARAKFHDGRRRQQSGRYQGLTFWTPNVNIFRDPRWGRGQETYGEDPYLASRMGVAVVRGLQGPADAQYDKLHACAKHYAVHSGPEWSRHSFNAENIEPRDLWETYLPAFKSLVQDGGVKEVMCAYNRFEGEPCCGSHRLLMQILREEWGFDGCVVSDCGAISDFYRAGTHGTHASSAAASASAVLSGTDLECGGDYASLPEAVRKGLIPEEKIDTSVFRLLKARFELGEMDDDALVEWSRIPVDVVSSDAHRRLALEVARKSMTLLANNGILPLPKQAGRMVVMGPNANDSVMQWGNYNGTPVHTVTVLEAIREKLGQDVVYMQGCDAVARKMFHSLFDQLHTPDGGKGMAACYWNNKTLEGEPAVKKTYTLPLHFDTGGATVFAPGVNLTDFSARYSGVFRPERSGTIVMAAEGDDGYRVRVNGKEVINYWGEHASEKRTCTFDVKAGEEYVIELDYMQAQGEANLGFDFGEYLDFEPEQVIGMLGDAEVVIFVGGISPKLEGEEMHVNHPGFRGGDRTDIELPEVQRILLKKLKEAGKKVVFVNCSGSAVGLVPEAEVCDAILQAWYPGEQGGRAVADVLFGDYNPAGRLPITFYRNISQLPDYEDYSMEGRTYRYMKEKPLFCFGHGLSYTDFRYGKIKVDRKKVTCGDSVVVHVPVKNTGSRDGDEVVQVYVGNMQSADGSNPALRAFRRISLKAGESQDVRIVLPSKAFEFFDTATNTMRVVAGRYGIYCGGSSEKAREAKACQVTLKP